MTDCNKCGQKLPNPKFEVGDCVKRPNSDLLFIVTATTDNTIALNDGSIWVNDLFRLVYPAKVVGAIKGSWRMWDRINRGVDVDSWIADAYGLRYRIGALLPDSVVAELITEACIEQRKEMDVRQDRKCSTCNYPVKEGYCCKSFKYEQNKMEFYYTDNYGYISKSIGSKLTYCPFCGKKLEKEHR